MRDPHVSLPRPNITHYSVEPMRRERYTLGEYTYVRALAARTLFDCCAEWASIQFDDAAQIVSMVLSVSLNGNEADNWPVCVWECRVPNINDWAAVRERFEASVDCALRTITRTETTRLLPWQGFPAARYVYVERLGAEEPR